jgi:hypothetical protein
LPDQKATPASVKSTKATKNLEAEFKPDETIDDVEMLSRRDSAMSANAKQGKKQKSVHFSTL